MGGDGSGGSVVHTTTKQKNHLKSTNSQILFFIKKTDYDACVTFGDLLAADNKYIEKIRLF